jgi:hypothetical protein
MPAMMVAASEPAKSAGVARGPIAGSPRSLTLQGQTSARRVSKQSLRLP